MSQQPNVLEQQQSLDSQPHQPGSLDSLPRASQQQQRMDGNCGQPYPPQQQQRMDGNHGQLYPPQQQQCAPQYPPQQQIVRVQSSTFVQPMIVVGSCPMQAICPSCNVHVRTVVSKNTRGMWWLVFILLFIFSSCLCLCFIPYCIDDLYNIVHICPNCRAVIGVNHH